MANEVFGDGLLLLIGQLEQELPRLRDVLDDDRALGRDPALNSAHGTGLSLGATTRKMGDRLVKSQEAIARTVRSVFPAAERAGDEATAHPITQRRQIHEKTAWMLRSMLEAP